MTAKKKISMKHVTPKADTDKSRVGIVLKACFAVPNTRMLFFRLVYAIPFLNCIFDPSIPLLHDSFEDMSG